MKEFTTSKARILFVSVPEIKDKDYWTVIDDRFLVSWNNSYHLPDGQWQFLTLLKDADEEKARSILPFTRRLVNDGVSELWADLYDNYVDSANNFEQALPSLHSLANHLGCEGNQVILVEKK